jgi:clan AA aspartic protease
MGIMHVDMIIRGKRSAKVSALVDTGATFTVVPRALAKRLQLYTMGGYRVKMADGRIRRLAHSTASVTVAGRTVPATILVSPDGGEVLLGAETLEVLGLAVDPRRRRLKAVHSATIMAA